MVKFFYILVKFFFSTRQKVAPKVKFFGKLVKFFGPNFLATLTKKQAPLALYQAHGRFPASRINVTMVLWIQELTHRTKKILGTYGLSRGNVALCSNIEYSFYQGQKISKWDRIASISVRNVESAPWRQCTALYSMQFA